jgi:uncharacterized repeat protein (TIGR03806 family)
MDDSIQWRTAVCILVLSLSLAGCGGGGGSDDDVPAPPDPTSAACVAPERPSIDTGVDFETVSVSAAPVVTKLLQEPASPGRWFVTQRAGRIFTYNEQPGSAPQLWIDFSEYVLPIGNGGLLSMAFHPDYPATPEIFVWYSSGTEEAFVMNLDRITVDDTSNPSSFSQESVLTVNQVDVVHQGGDLVFGPDGFLYLSQGDSGLEPDNYAQDARRLLGKVMRIDVATATKPYGIPGSNPYAGNELCGPDVNATECPEIYALGFRNPFRMSFDDMGRLWLADLGVSSAEEIDIVELGGNYGWPCREGSIDFQPWKCAIDAVLTDPVHEYDHSAGDVSITGGQIYTGSELPALQGSYIFGDWASGRIWALDEVATDEWESTEILNTVSSPTSFALDASGEIYFADFFSGDVNKLVVSDGEDVNTIPQLLSETGCVDPDNPTVFAADVTPYAINLPFWSDGAVKDRYMALPEGTTIDVAEDGDWEFPIGTVLIKEFRLNNELFETRLFMRHTDGEWAGYTYEWNEAGSDAIRVVGGRLTAVQGQDWLFPSEDQCMLCHQAASGFALGAETSQLNRDVIPASTGEPVNQLATLDDRMFFTTSIGNPDNLPRLAPPWDESRTLDERARAWLDVNCSYCHSEGGVTQTRIELNIERALADMRICNVEPGLGDLGYEGAMLLKPGDPDNSIIWQRLRTRGQNQMPPLATFLADEAGVQLIHDWIMSLESCN